MGTEGEQTRSGGYPERDGGEEGLGLGYYLVYRFQTERTGAFSISNSSHFKQNLLLQNPFLLPSFFL